MGDRKTLIFEGFMTKLGEIRFKVLEKLDLRFNWWENLGSWGQKIGIY